MRRIVKNPWNRHKDKITFLNKREIKDLFEAIKSDSKNAITPKEKLLNKRNIAMFNLIYFLGLRASEIQLLTYDDFDPYKKQIYVTALKQGISCMQRIDDVRCKLLQSYLKYRKEFNFIDNADPLFCCDKTNNGPQRHTIFYLMKKYATKARLGKNKRHPHVLRHSICIHLLESGLSIFEVQTHLRHADLRSTLKYSNYSTIQGNNAFQKIYTSKFIAK